jgi:4-carboxymuconolactone decarboxylase
MDIGSAVGRGQGINERQLAELAAFETSPAFTELERLVLRYAVAMTQTPVEVSDELFAGLRQHFDPRQMVELTSAIAWENYRARYNHAFGIEAEGFSDGAVCALPAPGPLAAGDGHVGHGAAHDHGRG